MGGCGSVVWFVDDVKSGGFASWLPSVPSPCLTMEKIQSRLQ